MKRSEVGLLSAAASILLLVFIFNGQALAAVDDRKTEAIKLGGSKVVETDHPIKRVAIADPDVADVVVLSPRQIYVYGKKVGYTSIVLWNDRTGDKTLLDVTISLDLTGLKEKIFELYPEQKIEVHGSETGLVLTGTVSGPEIVEQVLRLANSFLPVEGEGAGSTARGTGRSGAGVTNLLTIGGVQQVMLEVKFAEVRRDSGKEWQAALGIGKLGKDFIGAAGIDGVLTDFTDFADTPITGTFAQLGQQSATSVSLENNQFISGLIQNPRSLLLNFAGNNPNVFVNVDNVTAALRFLENEGLARTLAEPRLVAQSGQEASFLAGGEFPVQELGGDGTVGVEFKEFGVSLIFTPVVMSDGTISLRAQPSVSDVTGTIPVIGSGGTQSVAPTLVTRKLETTIQLKDGQTLALAGLLQDSLRETVSKVPLFGDIPILGALFRSTDYLQEKTDLLIAVTPHLVKPIQQEDLRYPGEFFEPPNWFEFYLEGRLEGRPKTAMTEESAEEPAEEPGEPMAAAFPGGGLEGNFGHSSKIIR